MFERLQHQARSTVNAGCTWYSKADAKNFDGSMNTDCPEEAPILVVHDISVFSPVLADPLVPAGRFMKAEFNAVFRIPRHVATDGFQDFLLQRDLFCLETRWQGQTSLFLCAGILLYTELSKYVQYPGASHMDAAHHVLRYLRGTHVYLLFT